MAPSMLTLEKHMATCARRSKVTAGPVVNLPVPYCHKYCTVPYRPVSYKETYNSFICTGANIVFNLWNSILDGYISPIDDESLWLILIDWLMINTNPPRYFDGVTQVIVLLKSQNFHGVRVRVRVTSISYSFRRWMRFWLRRMKVREGWRRKMSAWGL